MYSGSKNVGAHESSPIDPSNCNPYFFLSLNKATRIVSGFYKSYSFEFPSIVNFSVMKKIIYLWAKINFIDARSF